MNVLDGVNLAGGVAGVGAVVALIIYAARSHDDREDEEAARVFYDEHGYWPDEAPR